MLALQIQLLLDVPVLHGPALFLLPMATNYKTISVETQPPPAELTALWLMKEGLVTHFGNIVTFHFVRIWSLALSLECTFPFLILIRSKISLQL